MTPGKVKRQSAIIRLQLVLQFFLLPLPRICGLGPILKICVGSDNFRGLVSPCFLALLRVVGDVQQFAVA
jgi:hypothetical protein